MKYTSKSRSKDTSIKQSSPLKASVPKMQACTLLLPLMASCDSSVDDEVIEVQLPSLVLLSYPSPKKKRMLEATDALVPPMPFYWDPPHRPLFPYPIMLSLTYYPGSWLLPTCISGSGAGSEHLLWPISIILHQTPDTMGHIRKAESFWLREWGSSFWGQFPCPVGIAPQLSCQYAQLNLPVCVCILNSSFV